MGEASTDPSHEPDHGADAHPPSGEGYELAEPAAEGTSTTTAAAVPHRERSGKQVLSDPPRRRARLTAWTVLIACLIVAAVPMAIDLGRPAVIHEHEARSVAASIETWRHQTEWTYADHLFETLVPSYNDRPRFETPPGTTWMHLVALRFTGSGPDAPPTAHLVLASRIVSLIAGLVVIASVFWIGLTIGTLRTATLAALVCAAHPLVIYYSRLAGPEIVEMATMVFAVAAGVWAIQPLKMPGGLWRQASGWVVCGLALALAVLTGGLEHLPLILVPILLIFALYPHRLSHLMGLIAALIIAALVTLPWALYVYREQPEMWQTWANQLVPAYFDDPPLLGELAGQRLGLLVVVTIPWTAWLIAGLLQPMSTSSAGARLRMMLGWLWFVPVALLLIGAPGEPRLGEVAMVIPAAAVLTGQVIRQFADLSDEGRHARIWRWLRWPHAFVLMFAAAAVPAVGHLQDGMVRAGWLPHEVAMPMGLWYWLGGGAALMLVIILSMRFAEQNHPGRTIGCWAIWVILAAALTASPVARGPLMQTPLEAVGEEVRQATAGAPLYWFAGEPEHTDADDAAVTAPMAADARLVLYTRRDLRAVQLEQLEPLREEHELLFILAPEAHELPEPFDPHRTFASAELTLWRAGEPTED